MRLGWRQGVMAAVVAVSAGSAGCNKGGTFYESLNPSAGRPSGGEEVRLRGGGFRALGNLEVRIGGKAATNVGIADDNTVVFTTPEAREGDIGHPLSIYLLTSEGRSVVLRNAFTYRRNPNDSTGGSDLQRRL